MDRHVVEKHLANAYFQSIRADQTYSPLSQLPDFQIQSRLVFDLGVSDLACTQNKDLYRVKITRNTPQADTPQYVHLTENRMEWVPEKSGEYTFELVAFDENLRTSSPAQLTLNVVPPWYLNWALMTPIGLGVGTATVWVLAMLMRGIKHRKESRELREKLLNQETRARQHLETINDDLRKAQKNAVSARRDAELASEAKSLFLAKMSHEIRTPLNAVIGYSQMLKGNNMLDGQTLDGLSAIERSGQHLMEIINDILTLSKIESGHIETQSNDFALTELLDSITEMVSLHCKKKGLQFKIRCSEWWPTGHGGSFKSDKLSITPPWPHIAFHSDIAKIRQIVLNLITNSIKFTPSGSVTLEIRIQHPSKPKSLQTETVPRQVYFSVKDTGTGMEKEDIRRVFNAFEQGKLQGSGEHQGIGLGLAIANRLVQVLGGNLIGESEKGEGCHFHFTLPLLLAKRSISLGASKSKPQWKGNPPHALVVDDLEQNSTVLIRLLKLLDIPSESVTSGQDAIEYVQKNPTDVVFMDIMMPEMTGIEAFNKIRAKMGNASPKCIAYSAHVMEHEKDAYSKAAFDGLLAKPIEMDELIAWIYRLFPKKIKSLDDPDLTSEFHDEVSLLSTSIRSELKSAAERYAATELMRKLDQLETDGALSPETVKFFKSLARAGEMTHFIQLLE